MFDRFAARWTVALLAVLPMTGCYTYREASLASLSPGAQARLRLDQDGFGRVANQAAMNSFPVESLDLTGRGVVGRVVETEGDVMTMQLRGIGGAVFDAEVPVLAVQEFALRQLSARRTILAVGAVALLSIVTFSADWVGGTTSPPGPPDTDDLAPSFSIPVPIGFLFR